MGGIDFSEIILSLLIPEKPSEILAKEIDNHTSSPIINDWEWRWAVEEQ